MPRESALDRVTRIAAFIGQEVAVTTLDHLSSLNHTTTYRGTLIAIAERINGNGNMRGKQYDAVIRRPARTYTIALSRIRTITRED